MVNSTTQTGSAVDIVDVTHAFATDDGPLQVLDGISISAKPGSFTALVGPSGCGKSTLLRLLAGLDRSLIGTTYVDGKPVTGPSPERAVVFQDPTLLPWRTVRNNIGFGPDVRGTAKEQAKRVEESLELVGLGDFADAWPSQLSGGMAQRVALARALVSEPSLLLLDEPLGKLDALTRRTLQGELLTLWERNRYTAFLVTHDVSEALLLADRVIVFTPRPARIAGVFEVSEEVGEARPRDQASPEFLRIRREILALIDAGDAR